MLLSNILSIYYCTWTVYVNITVLRKYSGNVRTCASSWYHTVSLLPRGLGTRLGVLPDWCHTLTSVYPLLFSFEMRGVLYMHCAWNITVCVCVCVCVCVWVSGACVWCVQHAHWNDNVYLCNMQIATWQLTFTHKTAQWHGSVWNCWQYIHIQQQVWLSIIHFHMTSRKCTKCMNML